MRSRRIAALPKFCDKDFERERAMTKIISSVLAIVILLTISVFWIHRKSGATVKRFKISIAIETPTGIKRGSSVVEVNENLRRSPTYFDYRGTAVSIAISPTDTMYGILVGEDESNNYVQNLYNVIKSNQNSKHLNINIFPKYKYSDTIPMFLSFSNRHDPSSAHIIERLENGSKLENNTKLKEISISFSNEKIDRSIEDQLDWIRIYRRNRRNFNVPGANNRKIELSATSLSI